MQHRIIKTSRPQLTGPPGRKWWRLRYWLEGSSKPDTKYLGPAEGSNAKALEDQSGEGSLNWNPARWEDLPTFYQVVNALADLEVKEFLGGELARSIGAKDLSDQRILT